MTIIENLEEYTNYLSLKKGMVCNEVKALSKLRGKLMEKKYGAGLRYAHIANADAESIGKIKDELQKLMHSIIKAPPHDTAYYIPFDEKPAAVRAFNDFYKDMCGDIGNICSVDKLFDSTETHIRLLKDLQGGTELKNNARSRQELAARCGMSERALSEHLNALRDGRDLLGSTVRIRLERGTNNYDSTIHPVFLALNLSEVYFLTVVMKQHFRKTEYEEVSRSIAHDIYRQLTDYALKFVEEEYMRMEQGRIPPKSGYREERPDHDGLIYFLKSGERCELCLDDEHPRKRYGRINHQLMFVDERTGEKIPLQEKKYNKLVSAKKM